MACATVALYFCGVLLVTTFTSFGNCCGISGGCGAANSADSGECGVRSVD
jgi:hypothetical protein